MRIPNTLLLLALSLSACSGGGSPPTGSGGKTDPAKPSAVAVESGSGQTAPAGSVLPADLRVKVLTARGAPVSGVTVSWTVEAGAGAVSPASSVTDAQGIASARLTLGPALGSVSVRASAEGVPPVTLSATAGPPEPSGLVFSSVSAEFTYSCGLTPEGELYCWGTDAPGVLTTLTPESCSTNPSARCTSRPVRVAPSLRFTSLATGHYHMCALTREGDAYCWGARGEALGTGSASASATPVRVAGGHKFAAITAGTNHTCGLTTTGQAYCWGNNSLGQLGVPLQSGGSSLSPVRVSGDLTFASIEAGTDLTCAITPQGKAYCWGRNSGGQLGAGISPTQESFLTTPTPVAGSMSFRSLAVSGYHACGITSARKTYCWGDNYYMTLGTLSAEGSTVPVAVATDVQFERLSSTYTHTCGVTAEGKAYCWGGNRQGELGDGSVTTTAYGERTPVPVTGGLTFASVSAGTFHSCGVTTTGALYCWGSNNSRALGTGTAGNSPSPILVYGQR